MSRFEGAERYVATEDLKIAVNAAIALERPLLIVHGLADDNVVFDHSVRMIAALQKAGKPFELMVYPGQGHGIRAPELAEHQWKTMLDFLDRTVINAK